MMLPTELDEFYLPDALVSDVTRSLSWAQGGVFSLERLKELLSTGAASPFIAALSYDWFRKNRNIRSKIYFCLVHHDSPNAAAMKLSSGEYCIAIADSLQPVLHKFCSYLLATESLVSILGLPAEMAKVTMANHINLQRGQDGYPKVQLCDANKTAGLLLSLVSTSFVVFHELGHILLGHLDYLFPVPCGQRPASLLMEKDDTPRTKNHRLRQALESDADDFGITQMLPFITGTKLTQGTIFGSGPIRIAGLCGLAAQTFLQAMDFGQDYDPTWMEKLKTHPLRDFRINAIYSTATFLIDKHSYGFDPVAAKASLSSIGGAAMLAQSQLDGGPTKRFRQNRSINLQRMYGLYLAAELKRINSELEAVRPT